MRQVRLSFTNSASRQLTPPIRPAQQLLMLPVSEGTSNTKVVWLVLSAQSGDHSSGDFKTVRSVSIE